MTVYITFDWDPHPAVMGSQFLQTSRVIQDFEEPLRFSINSVIRPAFRENWDAEGRPPWVPLADATLDRWPNNPQILVNTGDLRAIATSMRPWAIRDNEAYLLAGSLGEAYYGYFHQESTKWMPARPWAVMTNKDEDNIQEIFSRWASATIAEQGLWGRTRSLLARIFRL